MSEIQVKNSYYTIELICLFDREYCNTHTHIISLMMFYLCVRSCGVGFLMMQTSLFPCIKGCPWILHMANVGHISDSPLCIQLYESWRLTEYILCWLATPLYPQYKFMSQVCALGSTTPIPVGAPLAYPTVIKCSLWPRQKAMGNTDKSQLSQNV